MIIKETKDYGLFKKLKGNRPVEEKNVRALMESFNAEYLKTIVEINEKFEVIDGQHRIEACKRMNLPVYYIIRHGWGIKQVHMINNTQKDWKTINYLNGYCDQGLSDYLRFRKFKDKYCEFNFTIVLSAALGINEKPADMHLKSFKNGLFKFSTNNDCDSNLIKLQLIKPYYKGYNRTSFAYAFFKALSDPKFEFTTFLRKLEFQSLKLVNCTTRDQCLMLIEEIYNYKTREDSKIRITSWN